VVQLGISPIAGGLCSKFGRRRVLIVGVFIVSGGTFLFGLVPPAALSLGIPMMPLFIVARVLQGTGSALTMTCIFAILSDAFPDSRGRIIGVAEMMNSLGWTVGPPMGGLLFAIGGFTLPFLICGALPLLTLAGVLSVFPEGGTTPRAVPVALSTSEAEADQMDAEDEEVDHADQASCVALLQRARRLATPGLFVTAFAATTPGTIFALWDIGFTPFVVEEFGFSLETVGLYFAIGPGMCVHKRLPITRIPACLPACPPT
jgi:MFS family permease